MKKIKFLLFALLIIASFSLNSCGEDEPVDGFVKEGSESPTTPADPSAGLFTANFNGATWTATNIEAYVYNNTITIIAKKANGENFIIGVVEGSIAGVYPANKNEIGYTPAGTDMGYWSVNDNDPAEATGSITVSNINTSKKTISGTFNFKGYWEDTTKAPIFFTNGVFKDIPFTNANPATGGGTTGGGTTGGGTTTPGSGILLKKTIDTDSNGDKITTIYNYNGNKIVSSIDDSGESNIYVTYTGDLITKIEYKFPNGTVEQTDLYTYNSNGKLSSYVRIDPIMKWGNKEVYTHNSDGSISVKNYIGDDLSQTQEDGGGTVKFLNGEVSEIINTSSPKMTYQFDNKNNPFKNVTGMDKIAFTAGIGDGILHNVISESYDADVFTTTYTYNTDSYPVTSIYTEYGLKTTTQYFY